MLCGKIASGKSTLASRLANQNGAILLSEDSWLNALYSDVMVSSSDYMRCSSKLRIIMGPHIASVLNAGISVVLDFPANTVETRKWMRDIVKKTNAAHQLHILNVSDEICLDRLHKRNEQGDHPFAITEELFHQFSKHLVAPSQAEGFNTTTHDETA